MITIPTRTLDRPADDWSAALAPRSTRAAVGALALSAVALALFFGGAGAIFGPVNDVLLALTFILLVPAVVAVGRIGAAPGWLRVLGWIALVGMAILVIGNVLLVARIIPLPVSFVTVFVGIVALIGWGVAVGILALRGRLLEPSVGRWIAATAITFILAAAAWALVPIEAWSAFGGALVVAFVGWLISLARALERHRRAASPR